LREHFQTVRVRQLKIEQEDSGRILFEYAQSVGCRGSSFGVITVPAEERLEGEENRPLIVDDENASIFSGHGRASSSGSSLLGGEA
jgi:hypothetical protein